MGITRRYLCEGCLVEFNLVIEPMYDEAHILESHPDIYHDLDEILCPICGDGHVTIQD